MGKNQKHRSLNGPAGSWLLEAVKGKKRYVAVETLLQALIGLGYICYSLLFREMIDRAVGKDTPGFFRFVLLLASVALVRIILRAILRWLEEYTCAAVENALKERLFSTLLSRDYEQVTARHTAQWMNRLTSDTVVVATSVTQIIPNLGGMFVKMAGAFVCIMILQPLFGLIVIPAGLVLILVGYVIRPVTKRLHKRIQESDGDVRVLLQERLDNLLIVDAYSQQDKSVAMAKKYMAEHLHARMKRNHVSNLNQVFFGIAMQGMYLLAAGYCAWGILNGTVSYGTMTAMLQMVSYLQSPFSGVGGYFTQWYAMLSSAERLMEAESLAPDVGTTQNHMPDFTAIRLDKLRFSYVDRAEGQELSVKLHYGDHVFHKGEFVALAGHSGCGKSTLLKLLLGVYKPDSGSMVLENDGEKITLNGSHRGLFAYVPQGNMLMSGTLRQILAFYDETDMGREDDLWSALTIACAADFVKELPQGLDTPLGEHGAGLSEGQIQRIALARAVFSGHPVLLLDEATSALDEQTEAAVLDNLKSMTDRTVLIVTHRPRACEICHRVIHMDNSVEAEGGSHAQQ